MLFFLGMVPSAPLKRRFARNRPRVNLSLALPQKEDRSSSKHQFSEGELAVGFRKDKCLKDLNVVPMWVNWISTSFWGHVEEMFFQKLLEVLQPFLHRSQLNTGCFILFTSCSHNLPFGKKKTAPRLINIIKRKYIIWLSFSSQLLPEGNHQNPAETPRNIFKFLPQH